MSYYRNAYYYRRYRRHRSKSPNIVEMIAEIVFGLFVMVWVSFFGLLKLLFTGGKKMTGLFKLNEKVVVANPTPPEITGDRYRLKGSLLSESERGFFEVLKTVVGDRYIIEPQVQLSALVTPTDSSEHFTNYRDFNKIKAKSIDFVLFDLEYKPHLAIELDDSSHLRWDRMERDHFVGQVMGEVGLKIIRVPVSYSYNSDELKKLIFG